MDLDQEILDRLTTFEDHFTERREAPQEHRFRRTIVAFANSVIAEKHGIIYVGVTNKGEVVGGGGDMKKWQDDITSWANSCYPPIPIVTRSVSYKDTHFLAVVVPASPSRPHFAGPAYKKAGEGTTVMSEQEIDEWIAYRNSKVRLILESKNKKVTVRIVPKTGLGAGMFTEGGEHTVVTCNSHFVTLYQHQYKRTITHPLSAIDLKMDDEKNQLMLLLVPYF